jgi:hypothetical protein
MYATFIVDFICVILLLGTFFFLWKQRQRVYSIRPLLPAVVFLAVSHVCDILVEHPNLHAADYLCIPAALFELIFTNFSNIADAIGISFLIYGFMTIIKHEQTEREHIHELEQMLPLCSNCKKYRTEDGQWLPIEKYLVDSGAPQLTHGICPECSEKLYGHTFK